MTRNAKYTAHALCEGLTLHHIASDRFKSERMQISYSVPLCKEYTAKTALLAAVLGRGSHLYPDIEMLSSALDDLYCATAYVDCGRVGEVQLLSFSMRALKATCIPDGTEVFLKTLSILSSLMMDPFLENGTFSSAYMENEKQNLINRIRGRVSNKDTFAGVRCIEELTKNEPYAASVLSEDDIAPITPEILYAHYNDILAHAPIHVFYIGEKSVEELSAALLAALAPLSHMRTAASLWTPQTGVLRHFTDPVRTVSEEMETKQSRICIGCRTGSVLSDGDFYIFTLFNEILSTSATSRLFMRVREEMNLCYYCSTSVDAHKGIMRISSGVDPANVQKALNAILRELDDLAKGNISDEELALAKRSLVAGYRTVEDSATALLTWYANRAFAGIQTTPDEAAEQVQAVTKDEIAEKARKISPELIYVIEASGREEEDDEA